MDVKQVDPKYSGTWQKRAPSVSYFRFVAARDRVLCTSSLELYYTLSAYLRATRFPHVAEKHYLAALIEPELVNLVERALLRKVFLPIQPFEVPLSHSS